MRRVPSDKPLILLSVCDQCCKTQELMGHHAASILRQTLDPPGRL
eukprot:CAMPEP_0177689734 /NCGR_PEP_ID=MMETSP0484_2-20121128/364_1 /TAXON_ID=354590 /ORGANISM="Rhodomonas lens, Strain RHODO" /LENGTH=44 /DNA_ID= /DNA_START= /DNA_END= /DNA_ORIENTATION=